jgi:hypothetical protein
VVGAYDIVARVETESAEKLTKVIFGDIRGMAGVSVTAALVVTEL